MSEFIFSCPHCQQLLGADSSMIGTQIDCPLCSSKLIVQKLSASQPQGPRAKAGGGGVCPYCRTEIIAMDRAQLCPTCHTPHHEECWKENKGCTVFGCAMAPVEEEKISVSFPRGATGPSQISGGSRSPVLQSQKTNAPGAKSSMIYGIVGLFLCGLIFGVVAISTASKAKALIQAHPDRYTGEDLATAGMVIGIVDLVAWGLFLLTKMVGMGT